MTLGQAQRVQAIVGKLEQAYKAGELDIQTALARAVNACLEVIGEGKLDSTSWQRVTRIPLAGHAVILFRDAAVCGTFVIPEPSSLGGPAPRGNL